MKYRICLIYRAPQHFVSITVHPFCTHAVHGKSDIHGTPLKNLYHILFFTGSVNFLTADGQKFSHPLYHLGKSTSDLPIIAIDSFRHMYLWKHNPKEHMEWVPPLSACLL